LAEAFPLNLPIIEVTVRLPPRRNVMTTATLVKYEAKTFPGLAALKGITQTEVEEHLKLYKGYVNNVNMLKDRIHTLVESGTVDTPEFAELSRRMGFEINGMRCHEIYFGNLGAGRDNPGEIVKAAIIESFGTWEKWELEFRKLAAMRGVGWVFLYKDPETGCLTNHWIGMHEEGHPSGFVPILALDVWEHAWTAYLKPTERGRYIDDFFKNINWEAVEKRIG
jgi:Fe-Mn family superoxide dismutase